VPHARHGSVETAITLDAHAIRAKCGSQNRTRSGKRRTGRLTKGPSTASWVAQCDRSAIRRMMGIGTPRKNNSI